MKSPEETNIELSEIGFVFPNVFCSKTLIISTCLSESNRQQDDRWKGHQNYIDGGMA